MLVGVISKEGLTKEGLAGHSQCHTQRGIGGAANPSLGLTPTAQHYHNPTLLQSFFKYDTDCIPPILLLV